jgi:hypothetical protein
MYFRAVGLLFGHPSILAVPLLAAVFDVLVDRIVPLLTDALGGAGAGLFAMVVQLVYLWAFGVAIVQASNVWRQRRGSFDEAWEESRAKFGGIALAAIGFQFLIWVGPYIGSFLGATGVYLGLALEAIAAFFLIYTMPAAAIGGMPGSLAIAASVRGVRSNVIASVVLAIVFIALWFVVLPLLLPYPLARLPELPSQLAAAAAKAIVLAYLAFPFAKQYDDVAFTRFW